MHLPAPGALRRGATHGRVQPQGNKGTCLFCDETFVTNVSTADLCDLSLRKDLGLLLISVVLQLCILEGQNSKSLFPLRAMKRFVVVVCYTSWSYKIHEVALSV